jgi:hypothetical protein
VTPNDDHDKRHVEAHEFRWLRNQVMLLSDRARFLEHEVRELRALVTPLDPGSLPRQGKEQP